jgi:integrase
MIDKGLNISTIKNYYNNIRHIFDSAITQYRIININPTVGVNIPKYKKTVGKKVLSLEEYNALLLDFTSSRFYIVLLLAGSCGLRLGEIAGVTRDNIDKKNKTLKIEKQWKKLKDGTMGFSYLKTNNSNRMIPLSDELIKKLDLYMIENKVDSTNRLIVRSICNYSSELNKELKKYNTTIHKLRHTYATTLISNGIDFKTAAKILGHDVIQTMKTYSHVNDRMMENAANKINDIFK